MQTFIFDNVAYMYECSFELNGRPMSEFKIGAASKVCALSFPAFSGRFAHVNRKLSACTPDLGPIPPGTYYILDRQSGGRLGPLWDLFNDHSNWFALYADDGTIDDKTFCDKVERGNFRLHAKGSLGVSKGCITIEDPAHFYKIRALLKGTTQIKIPGTNMLAYGKVVVK